MITTRRSKRSRRWTVRPPCPRDLEAARHLAGQALKILAAIPADLADDLAAAIFANAPGMSAERRIAQMFEDVIHRGWSFSQWLYPVKQRCSGRHNGLSARALVREAHGQPRPRVAAPDPAQPGYIKELIVRYRRRPIPYGARLLGRKITSSGDVLQLFRNLRDEPREHVFAVHLSGARIVQSIDHVAMGGLTESAAPVPTILRNALLAAAAAIVVVHNHPSGEPFPSGQDYECLDALKRACKFIGISLLDFVIIGEDQCWSASDHCLLNPVPGVVPAQPDGGSRRKQRRPGKRKAAHLSAGTGTKRLGASGA